MESPDTFELSLAELFESATSWDPYPWQVPRPVATQGIWLIEGGRGIGKTDGLARYVDEHAKGPACDVKLKGGHRIAIVAPTLDDAAESCVSGPSGLQAHNRSIRLRTTLGGSKAVWPNGAEAKLFSGKTEEDADRLRAGGNRCLVWIEEAAAIKHLDTALKQARYGLRMGSHPHIVASSTPKRVKAYIALRNDPMTLRTHGTTEQAIHLDPEVRKRLYDDYAGTRLGRQELLGQLLEDIEGALWRLDWFDEQRISQDELPTLTRVVVGVDPAVTTGENSDETGIVAAGVDAAGEFYILDDASIHQGLADCARHVLAASDRNHADRIIGEVNNGGDLVEHTLRAYDRNVAYTKVNASRGKRVRAEPVAALYEQGRVHHVGSFPVLEDQMASWAPDSNGSSPDRVDALVWAITALMGGRRGPRITHAGRVDRQTVEQLATVA